MKTLAEFRSDAFPACPGEEEEVNPGIWGKRLAEFLVTGLRQHGIAARDPGAEDWGWMIPIQNDEFPLWVGCANYEEYSDGFICFVEPNKPVVRRWFKRVSTEAQVTAVTEALDSVLRKEPSIRGVRWWAVSEFNHPKAEQNAAADARNARG